MTEPNVVPYLDLLKTLGLNAKDWLIKTAKSKTVWFASALSAFGMAETFLPQMQGVIPDSWYGPIFAVVGVVTALLRFATTQAISEK